MIRRAAIASLAAVTSVVTLRAIARRGSRRLLDAPRTTPSEAALGPALDALGGEIARFGSRDGLRLSGRWLPAEASPDGEWQPDPAVAILLLHGWSGSSAPDLVEYGPFLRRTAGVLGLDFRGHGGSDPSPATFGLREVEDVAGALAWLGGRGIDRVALVGSSMGGITALASVAVLGDGSLPSADAVADAPASAVVGQPGRPRIVAVVADSVPPELVVSVGARLPAAAPVRRFVAGRLLDAASRQLGGDPRDTEPIRVVGLLEGLPLMLISGEEDTTVPIADARRLAAAAPPGTTHLVIGGAGHAEAHATDPVRYEAAVTAFLRDAWSLSSQAEVDPIIATPGQSQSDPSDPVDVPDPTTPLED
ncbi:MAG TPA: alpha/beta hydrolase [Candidatus Limnocylindrales bacterium]